MGGSCFKAEDASDIPKKSNAGIQKQPEKSRVDEKD